MEHNDKNKDKHTDTAAGIETPPPPQIMDPTSHQEREAKKGAAEKEKSSKTKEPEKGKSKK
jgi:hypothetical protein